MKKSLLMVVRPYNYLTVALLGFFLIPQAHGQIVLDSAHTNKDRYSIGIENLNELDQEAFQSIVDNLRETAPELSDYIVTFAYGDIYENSLLAQREKQLIIIASLTTKGDALPQLKFHIKAGLKIGLKPEEIKDAILQTLPYVGFPEVLNAILVLKTVVEEGE
ncbi:MAG: carboxymuconolactone decarboxylase family protein [Bacteroidota bacterium]